MNINQFKERYCFKCHKIKFLKSFNKFLKTLRNAGVCIDCQKERK